LKRIIQDKLLEPLSEMIIADRVIPGDTVRTTVVDGKIRIETSPRDEPSPR
jgi:hypothetical protein